MRQPGELRPYQQRIATHLYEHDEAMCVVRPGGGKTVAALTAISDLLQEEIIRHALIIAPKRVARVVWPDEINGWTHTRPLRFEVLDGSPAERLRQLATAGDRDLTIVGLDILPWLVEQLAKYPDDHPLFDLLVIDEISRLRNPKGERVKALIRLVSKWRMVWGLTGTLRPSGAEDMFMPARVVTRGKLWGRSFYQWRRTFFYPTDYLGHTWTPLPGAEAGLNADIAPLIATVAEGELVQVEPTIILDRVTLPPEAREKYRSMERSLLARIGDETVIAASSAIATGKLAQIANGFIYDDDRDHWVHDAKREWLEDLTVDATEPMLLIYEFRDDLELLRNVLGIDLPYLGAGVSDAQAAAHIADWNAGALPFMALHPASGGHGLNLQHGGADMAWLAPCWSPEFWEQTIARLNRSGQPRQVMVRVCVADQTVDDMKLSRVHVKMTAQQAFEAYLRSCQEMV